MRKWVFGLTILLGALSVFAKQGGIIDARPCEFGVGPDGKPKVMSHLIELRIDGKLSGKCIDRDRDAQIKSDPKAAAIRMADASPEVLGELRKLDAISVDAVNSTGGTR